MEYCERRLLWMCRRSIRVHLPFTLMLSRPSSPMSFKTTYPVLLPLPNPASPFLDPSTSLAWSRRALPGTQRAIKTLRQQSALETRQRKEWPRRGANLPYTNSNYESGRRPLTVPRRRRRSNRGPSGRGGEFSAIQRLCLLVVNNFTCSKASPRDRPKKEKKKERVQPGLSL